MHPLLRLLLDAAEGRFLPPDGEVTVLPAMPGGLECSVAFTGHGVVATELAPDAVHALGPDGFGGSMAPDFLRAVAGPTGRVGDLDVMLTRPGTGGRPSLQPLTGSDEHPRVQYARDLRTDLRVYGDPARGLVVLASGLAGRLELSIELHRLPEAGNGHGRSLITDALTLVPAGEPVFAAVSPGNARSLRAFLAAGFIPIGSEVIVRPAREA
ncbi:hypothetical protein [Actinoplanes sp. TFC3]|uniref:hypothetical protein n=1 Tax=Actinoplanes sp. TFC3 TaxID=1710355 RepID=UPI001F35BA74|nr:hypothetical protein [Actinoplanes sp. TFC3]